MKRSFWQRVLFKLRRWMGRSSNAGVTEGPAASPDRPAAEAHRPAPGQSGDPDPTPPKPARAEINGAAVFGIDFGTTFTSVAFVNGERLTLLRDDRDNTMFPSIVCYPLRGEVAVGWSARERSVMHPATTFSSPKRLIGRRYDDRHLEPVLAASAVPTRAGPNGMVVADVHGDTLAMPQVCAEVFKHAAELGVGETGQPIRRVVLSVPVEYQQERAAIRRAAEMGGLQVAGMIEEPIAAAIGYGFNQQAGLVAVYDFGGGTFDCTLLEVRDGRFRVLAKAGDAWLGGDDFDLALAEHASRAFWRQAKVELKQRRVEWNRVIVACETAKRQLSEQSEAELFLKDLVLTSGGPIDLRMKLDGQLLAQLCGPLVDRSIEKMSGCLERAGVAPRDISHIAMTGGVCRMPLVRQRVEQYFGRQVPSAIDPEHAVVMGNAIYAHFLASAG
jgi:molecular chaperone DnaK